jgi:hypothetical protein
VHGYRAVRDPIRRSAAAPGSSVHPFPLEPGAPLVTTVELSPAIETHTAAAEMAASKRVIH